MDGDFYEDDEPIEEVRAAYEKGEKGKTARPRDLNRRAHSIVDAAAGLSVEKPGDGGVEVAGASVTVTRLRFEEPPVLSSEDITTPA